MMIEKLSDLSSIYFVIIFLIPGFVSSQAIRIICPDTLRKTKDIFTAYISLSSLNFAICSFFLIFINETKNIVVFNLILSLYVFIIPFVSGVIIGGLIQNNVFRRLMKTKPFSWTKIRPTAYGQSAWDSLFSNIEGRYGIVILQDDTKFRVLLSVNSFVSSDPEERDIYFEEVFADQEDGKPWISINRGLYLPKDQIKSIEVFHP